MSHLLGSKFCIESLRQDVTDLQSTVIDVFSRAGPVAQPSWKFPDKVSSELDMDDILDQYEYSEDVDESQVAHLVLLELVIDRHVLLLQAMHKYIDQLLSMSRAPSATQGHKASVSVGLTVRKFWAKLVHLYASIQQMQSQIKTKDRKIAELEARVKELSGSTERLPVTSGEERSPCFPPPSQTPPSTPTIARDCCFKSSQTEETSFVPCDACLRVQNNLREIGSHVISLCQSQGLSPSLVKFTRRYGDTDWLTANDVNQWTIEQNKDTIKLTEHLQKLVSTIQPLKESLHKSQHECLNLNGKIQEMTRSLDEEKETSSTQMKMYERALSDAKLGASISVDDVKTANRKLEHDIKDSHRYVEKLKAEVATREEHVFKLEEEKVQLAAELCTAVIQSDQLSRLNNDLEAVQQELDDSRTRLQLVSKDLAKEQAKTRSLTKQQQALQGKQDSLLSRIGDLDDENEDLKRQLNDEEDKRDVLSDKMLNETRNKKRSEDQLHRQERTIHALEEDRLTLEKNFVSLKNELNEAQQGLSEAKERERLIVEYPDLNGPVNADMHGTGDIALDMENQVKANQVRIRVLEDQNAGLRHSITKMMTNTRNTIRDTTRDTARDAKEFAPMPLWNHQNLVGPRDQEANRPEPHPDRAQPKSNKQDAVSQPFMVQKGVAITGNIVKGRQSQSGKARTPPARPPTSSIGAYLQLKKSGLLQTQANSHGPRGEPAADYQPQDTYVCSQCDKMYMTAADLDIHRSYCYGGK